MTNRIAGSGVAFRAAALGLRPDLTAKTFDGSVDVSLAAALSSPVATDAGGNVKTSAVARALVLSPELLGQLISVRTVAPVEHLPVADSASGSVFHDRADPNLRWYLPAFAAVDPDPSFAFDAVQANVAASGDKPFNRATLTFHIKPIDPPDLPAARLAEPGATFQTIPIADLHATLELPYVDDAGLDQRTSVSVALTAQQDLTYRVDVAGLVGPSVVLCWSDFRIDPQAFLTLTLTYRVCRRVAADPPAWLLKAAARGALLREPTEIAPPTLDLVGPPVKPEPIVLTANEASPFGRLRRVVSDGGGDGVPDASDGYVDGSATSMSTLALAPVYGAGPYLASYRVTANGQTRPIVDVGDLVEFSLARSEYVELTSLGSVPARYPSLRRLYIGQLTGNVVAIPAAYGILRGAGGCAAIVSAIVDERAESLSGCQFQLTFGLAPVINPLDLARLADDLLATPEAAKHGRLTLLLPSGLDRRLASGMDTSLVTSSAFADGQDPSTLLLTLAIQDDDVPAVNKVNAFLSALRLSAGMSLFGHVAVRLDDVFEPPVTTTALLNLHATSDGDDLLIEVSDGSSSAEVTVAAPFPLRLDRWAEHVGGKVAETALGQVLQSGEKASLQLGEPADAQTAILVQRAIAIDDAAPTTSLAKYVRFQAQTIQQTQYRFGLDGSGLAFGSLGASEIAIAIALIGMPAIHVDNMILTPAHRIESALVLIPIGVVVSGLAASLSARLTLNDGGLRDVALTHDFWNDPTFVLETASFA